MAKTLYLLRHGATAANGRFIGATDLPVAAEGYAQLDKTRDRLRQQDINTILCSPMLRCRQTAEYLRAGAEISILDTLREIDFGVWEGKTFAEIADAWPDGVRDWGVWSERFTFPGGENIGAFLHRISQVTTWIDSCPDENILLVTHGGVIRHLICHYLGISPEKYLLFEVKAGCYASISLHNDGGILTSLNCD